MNKDKQELIDTYLLDNLEGEELARFKKMVKEDPELARELKFQQEVLDSIRDEEKFALRDTLKEVSKEPAHHLFIHRYSRRAQLAAAVIVLMIAIGGGYFFRMAFNTPDSSQRLFNEYFAPEYDLMTVRSITSSNTVLNEGMNHFANRDYANAINSFNQVPDNMLGRLYAGFSYMHLEEYDDAEKKFKEIIDEGNNMFIDQAAWHLGLCYLATDKTEQAKTTLTDIANSNTFYKTKALELLTRMGND